MADSRPGRSGFLTAAAAACVVLVLTLGLMVRLRYGALQDLDTDLGTPAESWSLHHAGVVRALLVIEVLFGTLGTATYVLGFVVVLLAHGRRRAAAFTVLVMVAASVTTTLLKLVLRRHRPAWHDPVHALTSFSFPSGHASGIASGMGVAVVLTLLYVHDRRLRTTAMAVAGILVLVVGADRVLLGVHNVSDVVAGYAVGAFWVVVMLVVYPPQSPREGQQELLAPGRRQVAEAEQSVGPGEHHHPGDLRAHPADPQA